MSVLYVVVPGISICPKAYSIILDVQDASAKPVIWIAKSFPLTAVTVLNIVPGKVRILLRILDSTYGTVQSHHTKVGYVLTSTRFNLL